jgi:hypothetical protein
MIDGGMFHDRLGRILGLEFLEVTSYHSSNWSHNTSVEGSTSQLVQSLVISPLRIY